jgi:predicted transcriptional regulator
MIGIEQYRKIQEYKALGLAQTKTAKALGITYSSVSKYWNMSEEDYVREAEKERYRSSPILCVKFLWSWQ